MKYIGEFYNLDGHLIEVKIVTNGDDNEQKELLLAADPLTITAVSDGLFTPIKSANCTIRILTEKIYADMYANTSQQSEVTVTNKQLNKVIFRGYVTPNIYSQDYVSLDNLEIEAVCAISALKNIKYESANNELKVVCWYTLIKKALQKVGYKKFHIADTYSIDKNNRDSLLLTHLYQFEGNFFDDDDEKTAWKYYDILEEFCRYFCLSLVVWNDEVYFMDYNYINSYITYDLTDESAIKHNITHRYIINADSYKETGAQISFDETFNKVSVKDNLYDLDLNTDAVDDDDLENMNDDKNKFYTFTKDIKEGKDTVNYTYMVGFFNNKRWDNTNPNNIEINPNDSNFSGLTNISFWQKVDEYPSKEVPHKLDWTTYLTVYNDGKENTQESPNNRYQFDIVKPKEYDDFIGDGGYFILNIDYKFSENILANDCLKSHDDVYIDRDSAQRIYPTRFPCLLSIGNYYYNGDSWQSYDDYYRKVNKGYFKKVYNGSPVGGATKRTWYKYKDEDGDWKFCVDEDEYFNLPSGIEKATGQNEVNHYYWWEGNKPNEYAKWVWIDDDFYNECLLGDCFFAVHVNKKDDKIFDEIKTMDNTASWEMNIKDSEEGIAIKLPNFLLSGKLKFAVKTPDVLGTYAQWRTDRPLDEVGKVNAIHIKKLTLDYKASGEVVNIFDNKVENDDVMYTNVIDDEYVNEWDDLELKVNTQVKNRVTSASSMLMQKDDETSFRFLDKIYSDSNKKEQLQEEHIIQNYFQHYNSPKLILECCLNNVIAPYSIVHENNLNKDFVVDSYEMNVGDNTNNIKLIEL